MIAVEEVLEKEKNNNLMNESSQEQILTARLFTNNTLTKSCYNLKKPNTEGSRTVSSKATLNAEINWLLVLSE
jgi:hypothetical protein